MLAVWRIFKRVLSPVETYLRLSTLYGIVRVEDEQA